MSTLAPKMDERVQALYFTRDSLVVDLRDGRSISMPLAWYPRLQKATVKQRSSWEICGRGYGIHWPEIDEDLNTEGLASGGAPAPKTQTQKHYKAKTPKAKRGTRVKRSS